MAAQHHKPAKGLHERDPRVSWYFNIMRRNDVPFIFININGNDEEQAEERARYEIRAQAASYTRRQKHRSKQQAISSTGGPTGRTPRRGGVGKQMQRVAEVRKVVSKVPANRDRETTSKDREASRTSLETKLLVPYGQPVEMRNQEWTDDLLNQYFNISCPQFWHHMHFDDLLGAPIEQYMNWGRFIIMRDPAHYCLQAWAAVFTLCPRGPNGRCSFYWIKAQAIHQINLALSDPSRMLSTATITAVMTFAFYEACEGNRKTAREVHVPALRRMLAMKGGEGAIRRDLPAFTMGYTRWIAQNLAMLCGVEAILEPLLPGLDPGFNLGGLASLSSGRLGSDILMQTGQAGESSVETGGESLMEINVDKGSSGTVLAEERPSCTQPS